MRIQKETTKSQDMGADTARAILYRFALPLTLLAGMVLY